MLWTVAAILLVMWALGMVGGFMMGGFIHALPVIAVIAVLIRLFSRRSVA